MNTGLRGADAVGLGKWKEIPNRFAKLNETVYKSFIPKPRFRHRLIEGGYYEFIGDAEMLLSNQIER